MVALYLRICSTSPFQGSQQRSPGVDCSTPDKTSGFYVGVWVWCGLQAAAREATALRSAMARGPKIHAKRRVFCGFGRWFGVWSSRKQKSWGKFGVWISRKPSSTIWVPPGFHHSAAKPRVVWGFCHDLHPGFDHSVSCKTQSPFNSCLFFRVRKEEM